MRKLLFAASSLIVLGAMSFSSQPILAGTDHLADALLDVSSHSKPSTRVLALKVVDDEITSDLPKLFHDVITTGKVTTDGPFKRKTLLEMMPIQQEQAQEGSSIFKANPQAITLTPFTLDPNVPSNIDRTVAHPLGVSLHFAAQSYPSFSGDLILTCAGITARSTFTFAADVLHSQNIGLLAGTIGMTGNNLTLLAEFETHLSSHVQALLDTVGRLRRELEETKSQLTSQRQGARSASGSRVTSSDPQRDRQMLLESMGMTADEVGAIQDRSLKKFLTMPAEHMETALEVREALRVGDIYRREFHTKQELWAAIEEKLRERLSDLEEE